MNRLHKEFVGSRPGNFLAGLVAALLAFPAGTAAAAQLYKWVDERGQVNYSDQLPADPKAADKVAAVEDRVSVYTPDPALVREMAANRRRVSEAGHERPAVQPPAVVMLGTPAPVPSLTYESHASVYPYPYWAGGTFKRRHYRPLSSIPQIKLPPGAIAGNMVGLYSIMPGNSAPLAGTLLPAAPQPAVHRPRHTRPSPYDHWRR